MNSLIHRAVYDILMHHYAQTGSMFLTRVNNCERLRGGFLFIGDGRYLQSSLWTGRDALATIYNIGIGVKIVDNMPRACFDLCCRSNPDLQGVFDVIRRKIHDQCAVRMVQGYKLYWSTILDGDYRDGIRKILQDFKPVVDEAIRPAGHSLGVRAIDKARFQTCMNTIRPYVN